MSDDSGLPLEPLEPLEPSIDVRSPGERWADSGRAGLERLKARVEQQRLDVAAVVWMALLFAIAGSEIYSALRFGNSQGFPGSSDWWFKLQLLAQSGGTVLVFGSAVGIALAVLLEGPMSRVALRLAVVGGAWSVAAGGCGVAFAFHPDPGFGSVRVFDGRLTECVYYLGFAGLGLLIAMIAWRFARQVEEG
jgi:hypothetical protein